MNYPIPGSSLTPTPQQAFNGPYFAVGNECCNGCMTNDIEARTKVMFDYTNELSIGVNVTTVTYDVQPPSGEALIVSNTTLTANIATFMVSGGVLGATYIVEALAQLDDGETWVDRISVTVTTCAAITSGSGIIVGPGPVIIASTLYYRATVAQTVFPLNVPDILGRTGVLVGSNVMVYANGSRLAPGDSYTVDVINNRIVLAWPAGVGESVIFDLVTNA